MNQHSCSLAAERVAGLWKAAAVAKTLVITVCFPTYVLCQTQFVSSSPHALSASRILCVAASPSQSTT